MLHDVGHKNLHVFEIHFRIHKSKIVTPHIEHVVVPIVSRSLSQVLYKCICFMRSIQEHSQYLT